MSKSIKNLFFAAIFIFAASSIFSIDLSVGGRGALALNVYDFKCGDDDESDLKLSAGYGLGAYANIGLPFLDGLGVQPEFVFAYHNIKKEKSNKDYDYHYMMLNIPVMATYRIPFTEMFFIQPAIGPRFSFVLGDVGGDSEFSLKSPFNFGIAAGAAFGINFTAGTVLLDLRYNRDFTKMIVDNSAETELGSAQFIEIGLSYQVKLFNR